MLSYEFYLNEIGTPQFHVKNELEIINELGSCDMVYLEEIVFSLEQLISKQLEEYSFGYEVYSIQCKNDISQVIDTFDNWKCVAEIPTNEIYKLMKEWLLFLINHKK